MQHNQQYLVLAALGIGNQAFARIGRITGLEPDRTAIATDQGVATIE